MTNIESGAVVLIDVIITFVRFLECEVDLGSKDWLDSF